MFLYCNAVMEPWDGPAAIAATDGHWVIAGLDRNGLRPLRYTITRSAMLIVGSEAGMVKIDESDVVEKGRVGPGQTIGVDLDERRFYGDDEMKNMLAARQPFGEWAKRIRVIDHIVKTDAPEPVLYEGEELRRRQLAVGMTLEELEMILHPMVEDAQEAVGSMGDDTPIAVLSEKYRGLHHYFRQNFSQVTNPPIDSLRETRVMSLKTRLGNLGNVLDEDSSQCDLLQLESPVLSTAEFVAMRDTMGDRPRASWIARSPPSDGEAGLRAAIERIRREAEEGVRAGCTHVILTDEASDRERARDPDDHRDRRGAHASRPLEPAYVHQPQRALRRMHGRPLFRRADRRRRDDRERVSRAGEHRRPSPARAVRRHFAEGCGVRATRKRSTRDC